MPSFSGFSDVNSGFSSLPSGISAYISLIQFIHNPYNLNINNMNRLKKLIGYTKNSKKNKKLFMDSKSASAIAAVCAALLPSSTIIKQPQQPNTQEFKTSY
jgi:hypothetical protein